MITPSSMSIGTEQGFSIIKYSGTGNAITVPHGLSKVPDFIIVKNLDVNDRQWTIQHKSLTYTHYIDLDSTNRAENNSSVWGSAPTSSVFSFGANPRGSEASQEHIGYCWHSVPGYSAMGSYKSNNSSDGPFVYTGFRPVWIMIKNADSTGSWIIHDTARNTNNPSKHHLRANTSGQEDPGTEEYIDILSNGFKSRGTGINVNSTSSGTKYIYMAFAEQTINFTTAR